MVEGTQISALENRSTELEKENLLLQEKAAFLTCKFYGRFTEQTSSLEIEGQMSFLMKRKRLLYEILKPTGFNKTQVRDILNLSLIHI